MLSHASTGRGPVMHDAIPAGGFARLYRCIAAGRRREALAGGRS